MSQKQQIKCILDEHTVLQKSMDLKFDYFQFMTTRRHLYTLHVPTSSYDSADDDDLFCNLASALSPFMGQIRFTHSTASAFCPRLMLMQAISSRVSTVEGPLFTTVKGSNRETLQFLFLVVCRFSKSMKNTALVKQ